MHVTLRSLTRTLPAIALALASFALLSSPSQTHAQSTDTWGIVPMATRGIDANVGATFVDILQSELSARNSAAFTRLDVMPCRDTPCAVRAGKAQNVNVAVYGNLSKLGSKVIVTITVVDVAKSGVLSSQKMVVDRIDDLDSVATRMAKAVLGGTNTDETAELGSITKQDSKPDERREGARGTSFRLGGVVPVNDSYGGSGSGILMDIGYWFETRNFAIEPRFGLRFNADSDGDSFFEVPIDVGAYYILGTGDFSPFVGGGMGVRYISESRSSTVSVGNIVVEESEVTLEDSGWGFGTFARAGVMLFRTYSLRLAVSVDYNLTLIELNEKSTAQSMTAGISVLF